MFKCEVIEKASKKTGEVYTCLKITFPTGYEKLVFLTPAEKHLVNVSK